MAKSQFSIGGKHSIWNGAFSMIKRNADFQSIQYNHSNALPRYIISLNVETFKTLNDPSGCSHNYTFRCGTAISARIRDNHPTGLLLHKLRHSEELWELIVDFTAQNYTTWIVAYDALSHFIWCDLTTKLLDSSCQVSWPRRNRADDDASDTSPRKQSLVVIDSPPTIIAMQCVKTQGRFVMVDTRNWFDASLADLAINCKSNQLPEPLYESPTPEWQAYSQRNCEIIFKTFASLIKWQNEQNLGMFRYTAASQAMGGYRHRFMNTPIYIHNDNEVKTMERAAYCGGRLLVNRIGEVNEKVYQLDVNSLFPSVMRDNLFPSALIESDVNNVEQSPIPWERSQNYLARVNVFTETADYPVKLAGKTIYPRGNFTCCLCGPELQQCLSSGKVNHTFGWAAYKTKPLFRDYITYFWTKRQQYKSDGNTLYEQFCKLMLNTLYGKFAQMSSAWININDDLSALPWTRWVKRNPVTNECEQFRSFAWQTQQKVNRGEIPQSFIAISAFVTSYARTRMNTLREIAGERQTFYQAIDCLFVSQKGYDNLEQAGEIDPTGLGKLRLIQVADGMRVGGNNDYTINGKTKIAGVSVINNEKDEVTYQTRKIMAKELLFCNEPAKRTVVELSQWRRLREWAHGKINFDGWTEPLDAADLPFADYVLETASGSKADATNSTASW